MSIITFKLDLDKEEDREYYKLINSAEGMREVIQDISGHFTNHPVSFRTLLKYAELDDKEYAIVEKLADRFYELLNEHNVKIFD